MLWEISQDLAAYQLIVIDLARKATLFRPNIVKNWETLALHLLGANDFDEAIAVLIEATYRFPQEARLHLMLADSYYQTQRSDLACEVLQRTPEIARDDRKTAVYRLELLMKTQTAKDARQIATATLALDPTNRTALRSLAKISRKSGNHELMLPICQAALEHNPGHTAARYELAFAYTILGRREEARRLVDLNRFIAVTELVTPHRYANAAAFQQALASEIIHNPTLKPDPPHRATKGGLQTMGGLPHDCEPAVSDVIALIRAAVDEYEANLIDALDHAFVQGRPKRASLNAWAVVLRGDGYQIAHIHPEGWVSGVYYVSVPKRLCGGPGDGTLVLGAMEMEGLSIDPPWGIREISPAPGRLVLFPSYLPHATIPTKSTDERICIAFDVEPCPP
jgi:tetratricopeptide (TPR) repeat protein